MQRLTCRLALPIAGLFVVSGMATSRAESISWAKSFDSAIAAAKSSNKLVMADFYTDW